MSERNAIVHIGTHKTGTTSLQLFFDANRDRFAGEGIYVTQSGRHGHLPGNHHIAWQLLSSDDSPALDLLTAELRSIDQRAALISAEDLSLLYARPAALDRLRAGIEVAGFVPTIVVYLRAHAPYIESMYIERIKHKYLRPFAAYLKTVLRDGVYIPDGSPIHLEYDYPRLLAPFVRAFGKERVVVRPYISTPDTVHVFRDFLGVLAAVEPTMARTPLNLTVPEARANDSLTFYDLLHAAHGACEPPKGAMSTLEAIVSAAPTVTERFLASRVHLLQRDEIEHIQARFAGDNETLMREYNVELSGVTTDAIRPADHELWHTAREQRDLFERLTATWLTKTTEGRRPPE